MVIKRNVDVVKEQICATIDKDLLEWIDARSEGKSRSKEINILLREVMNDKKVTEAKVHGRRENRVAEFVAETS